MNEALIERLKKEIEQFAPQADAVSIGRVAAIGDGVADVEGLPNVSMAEMVLFGEYDTKTLEEALLAKEPLYGLVLNLEEDLVRVIVLGDSARVSENMSVFSTGRTMSIPVSEALLGRVVNPLGEPIDGKGAIPEEARYAVERESYGVIDRAPVNTPVHTGLKAVDAMIPIGRGQRELIIGDRHTGKTTLAIDTILSQRFEKDEHRPVCIYVAIGQKESKTARIVSELEDRGAMEYTVVVTAPASAPAALQFLAPYAGAAIGEYIMEQGRDALVVYDDLSKHAVAYRQLSLLLRRPPGREAYPGDIFYLHSRLLERSAKLSKERGGGSLTALPIIETMEGDVSAYIPTNVISITDGQIYLAGDLFNKGTRPAINVGLSVSRVGSNAQTKAMKKVAGRIRLELAQFRELEAFMQFSQDLDKETKDRIDRGRLLSGVLNQNKHQPLPFAKQVVAIYAAVHGFFAGAEPGRISEVEERLHAFMEARGGSVIDAIRESGALADETEQKLEKLLKEFRVVHAEYFDEEHGA